MNPDECRKELKLPSKRELKERCKVWLDGREKIGFAPHDLAKFVGDVLGDAFAAWSSRTESKPVTREAIDKAYYDAANEILGAEHNDGGDENWEKAGLDAVYALQLSATQSPIVPISCSRCGDPVKVGVCENCYPDVSPVVPGADIGWVRSVLLNMKPSEIDDVARLIFDTLATGGHQSREDRYRQALESIVSKSRDKVGRGIVMTPSDAVDMVKLVREALATPNAKEPV